MIEPPQIRCPPMGSDALRRLVDIVVAGTALAFLAGPMLVVAAVIRLTSPGPALFRQQRIGQGGLPFTFYKFRTMRCGGSDADHRAMIAAELRGEDTSCDGSWKLADDPRITGLGAWLRRTSLDELPQLINVLRGEMTLVGPRPCLEWEAAMFPQEFAERFTVRPGITNLWVIRGRSTMGTLDMLRLDVEYVRTRSVGLDLAILAQTLPCLFRGDGAR